MIDELMVLNGPENSFCLSLFWPQKNITQQFPLLSSSSHRSIHFWVLSGGQMSISLIKQETNPTLLTWTEIKTEQWRLITHYLGVNLRNELAWLQNTLVILWTDYSFFLRQKTKPDLPWLSFAQCVTFYNPSGQVIETRLNLDLGCEVIVWLWADTELPKVTEDWVLKNRGTADTKNCSWIELWVQR